MKASDFSFLTIMMSFSSVCFTTEGWQYYAKLTTVSMGFISLIIFLYLLYNEHRSPVDEDINHNDYYEADPDYDYSKEDHVVDPKDRLFALGVTLQGLQPDLKKVGFEDGSFYIYFDDAPKMEIGEFEFNSPTRNILEEMSDLILGVKT